MKKLECENCLVQATCTKMCVDFAFQMMQIDHELKKNERFVLSKNKRRRKRLKDRHLDHYNTLIKKWNKGTRMREAIWERQYLRIGMNPHDVHPNVKEALMRVPLEDYIKKFYMEGGKMDEHVALKFQCDNTIIRSKR